MLKMIFQFVMLFLTFFAFYIAKLAQKHFWSSMSVSLHRLFNAAQKWQMHFYSNYNLYTLTIGAEVGMEVCFCHWFFFFYYYFFM